MMVIGPFLIPSLPLEPITISSDCVTIVGLSWIVSLQAKVGLTVAADNLSNWT